MQHERETLDAVIKARGSAVSAAQAAAAAPGDPAAMQGLAQAEGALGGALGRLFALFEAYPDLKANQNVLALQEELSSTENKIAFARQAYNDSVMEYNTARVLPRQHLRRLLGFAPAELLQCDRVRPTSAPRRRSRSVAWISSSSRSAAAAPPAARALVPRCGGAAPWRAMPRSARSCRGGSPSSSRRSWPADPLRLALPHVAVPRRRTRGRRLLGARLTSIPSAPHPPSASSSTWWRRWRSPSGVRVPAVYVHRRRGRGINAFAAGYSPAKRVIVVTARRARAALTRDELQGVMGHEFSHILNGDMALNLAPARAACRAPPGLATRPRRVFRLGAARGRRRGGQSGGARRSSSPRRGIDRLSGSLAASAIRRRSRASASSSPTRPACSSRAMPTRSPARSTRSRPPRAHRRARRERASGLAHMFFGAARRSCFGFATTADRRAIRRVITASNEEDYRAGATAAWRSRGARRRGNVAENVRMGRAEVVASVGRPFRDDVDFQQASC